MEEEIILMEENDIEEINIEEENYSGNSYELPIASADTLGGIKVGENLTIDEDGTLNATGELTGEYQETDPTIPQYVKDITPEDIEKWNNNNIDLTEYVKEEELKTINGQSLVGEGNIVIEGGSGGTTEQTELVIFGDSWTAPIVTDAIWSTKVAQALNLNLNNFAIDGAGFVEPANNLIGTQINTFINSNVDKTKVKYIVLMGGINDYKNSVSYDVLSTAVINAINTLKTVCPNAKILFSNNIEYNYDLQQYNYWKNLHNSIRNEVLVATYNMYGLYGINLFNSNNYCHLTQEGQILLAKNIMACLSGGELISSIDERRFETSDGLVVMRSELVSSNMAVVDLRFVPNVSKTSYTINFSDSLPKLPYAASIQMLGKIDKGYSQIICDVMDRTVAFASPNSLIVNYVYTFSIITPLY